jgi:hypothetical protein
MNSSHQGRARGSQRPRHRAGRASAPALASAAVLLAPGTVSPLKITVKGAHLSGGPGQSRAPLPCLIRHSASRPEGYGWTKVDS